MDTTNIVTAAYNETGITKTGKVFQWSKGQTLVLSGFEDLPASFEMQYQNADGTPLDALTQIGTDGEVVIPDTLLANGSNIEAWMYLPADDDTGTTVYRFVIPIVRRPRPADYTYTEAQATLVEQAISALNSAVGDAEQAVSDAQGYASNASDSADAALDSANDAATSESNAEAWANGTRNGSAVVSGDPAFENNSKYYAQEASGDADRAEAAYTQMTTGWTPNRALESDGTGALVSSAVTKAELNYLDGVTSAIQTQLDSKAAWADIASAFSTSADYTAGDYVYYNSDLYRFAADHAAGAWIGTDATAVVLADDVVELNSALSDTDSALFQVYRNYSWITTPSNWTIGQGIDYRDGANQTSSKHCRTGYIPIQYPILIVMTDNAYNFNVWEYSSESVSGATYSPKPTYDDKSTIILPKNSSAYFRIGVSRKDSANITSADTSALGSALKTYIITDQTLSLTGVPADAKATSDALSKKTGYVKVLLSSDNMDDYGENGVYCYAIGSLPLNAPDQDSNGVVLICHGYNSVGFASQIVTTNSGKLYIRNQYANGTWAPWSEVSGNVNNINNTYNITTSPTITTDTNGWLQAVDTSTSDEAGKTDMTGAIMSMLTDTGYCHLGEGIFYVSGSIDMPPHSMLCGCGEKSEIRLLSSVSTGYCVKMQEYCTINNVAFTGGYSNATITSKGTRDCIKFVANAYNPGGTTKVTAQCFIDNVWIQRFSGDALCLDNTSARYDRGLYATNLYIYNCYCGVDIVKRSEFNKFTNICTSWCTYGCINNGGNNTFVNCTFHAITTGFYIDGTQYNAGHGEMVGCTFCHIGSNAGKAIQIDNCENGFVISGCNFWYNSINISNSEGIVFNGCEFGRGTTSAGATITITAGNTVVFTGCMFMNDIIYAPDITITSNTKVKFVDCYGSSSGNAITAS